MSWVNFFGLSGAGRGLIFLTRVCVCVEWGEGGWYLWFVHTGKKNCFVFNVNIKLHKISLNSLDFGDFFRLKLGVLTNIIKGCLIWIGNIFFCSNTTKVFFRKSLRPMKYHFWGKLTKFLDFWDFFPLTFRIVVRFFSNSYFHMRTLYFND